MLITLFWLLHFAFGKYSIISLHSVVLATVYTFESSKRGGEFVFLDFLSKISLGVQFYFIFLDFRLCFYFIFQLLLFSSIFHFRINLCICLYVCEAYVHFMLFSFFILYLYYIQYTTHFFFYCWISIATYVIGQKTFSASEHCFSLFRREFIFPFTIFVSSFFMQFIVFVYSWISFSFILSIGTCYLTS